MARASKKVAKRATKVATTPNVVTELRRKAEEEGRTLMTVHRDVANLGRHEQRSNGSHYGPFERIDVLVHPRAASLIRSLADSGLFGVTESEVAERLLTESLRVMFPRAWK